MLLTISAATTISQVKPMAIAAPVNIEGEAPGTITFRNTCQGVAPIETAARRYLTSRVSTPPRTLITTVKNDPRKMIDTTVSSMLGQKRIESGTHARGGIGRSVSKTGKKVSLNTRLTPKARPIGTPRTTPMTYPMATRFALMYTADQ